MILEVNEDGTASIKGLNLEDLYHLSFIIMATLINHPLSINERKYKELNGEILKIIKTGDIAPTNSNG